MNIVFLPQMGQCNECGSARNDDIFNLHLDQMQALKSASPASCKTPATSIDRKHPNKQKGRNKESRNKIKLQTNRIELL